MSRQYPSNQIPQQVVELIEAQLVNFNEDSEPEQMYEQLYLLYQDPINLNKTSRQELARLFFLKPVVLENIWNYLHQNGPLLSIYELQVIEGMNPETFDLMTHFATVTTREYSQPFLKRLSAGSLMIISRIEYEDPRRAGFSDSSAADSFKGAPYRLNTRVRLYNPGDFSLGFSIDQDPGEIIKIDLSNRHYLFDHGSFHFYKESNGLFKKVVIGDYSAQFGQGLVLGTGFGLGKSVNIQLIKKMGQGIRPILTTGEYGFLRGIATTMQHRNFTLHALFSYKKYDANLNLGENEGFSGLVTSGLHRNQKELIKKHNLNLQHKGLDLNYRFSRNATTGITLSWLDFSLPWEPNNNVKNQFDFRGSRQIAGSWHYDWVYQNFNFFGELAMGLNIKPAYLGGLITSLSRSLDFAMIYRHYPPDYDILFSNAISESGNPQNEQGFYWLINYQPFSNLTLSASYDHFIFPWLQHTTDRPGTGHETVLRLEYKKRRSYQFIAQLKIEEKDKNVDNDHTGAHQVMPAIRKAGIIGADYKATDWLDLKTRFQFSNYSINDIISEGFLMLQDFNVSIQKIKIGYRFSVFTIDDFTNRQYVYEKDLRYNYSVPAFYNSGVRQYLITQFKWSKNLTCYVKVAQTSFPEALTSGSGVDKRSGKRYQQAKFQIIYSI